jgi:hypothetical protein
MAQSDELDDKVDNLKEGLLAAQRKAEGEVVHLTTEQYQEVRRRCKRDTYFLAKGILGYDRLVYHLHGHMCSQMRQSETERFRMFLLPRGNFKSTIVTETDSIQIALPDDDGTAPYPRNLGTSARILIAHETADGAQRKMVTIAGQFMSNPRLMGFFPECVPKLRHNRVNKAELELPREHIWDEPTFDTIGTGGRKQGAHYNFIKLDDLIGFETEKSPVEMKNAIAWFDNIQSFFSTFSKDRFDLIGTRWARNDLYNHAMEKYGDRLWMYVRAMEEMNELTGKKESIFPEEFPVEELVELKKNWKVYSAQYLNNPQEGTNYFNIAWLCYYEWDGHNRLRVGEGYVYLRDCDILILIDPSMSGGSGIVVTAVDYRNRVFVLEVLNQNFRPEELTKAVFQRVRRWQPRAVVVEEVIFSGLFQPYWYAEQRLTGLRFHVELNRIPKHEKEARVMGLSSYFSAGQIYVHASQKSFIEEYQDFGTIDGYHALDALSQGPKYWRGGRTHQQRQEIDQVIDDLLSGRDVNTGYSKI